MKDTSNLTQRKPSAKAESSKFWDPMERKSEKISKYVNTYHASVLLAIAWNIARKRDTHLAQLIQVDRLGFELRCHLSSGIYSEERVNFDCAPIDEAKKMVAYITQDMRGVAAGASWPTGPACNAVLGVYFLVALVYFESHGGEDLRFLPNEWAEHLPDRALLHNLLLCVFTCNALQAVACCFVLTKRARLTDRHHLPGWFFLSFFLAYPVWNQVSLLTKARTQGLMRRI